MDKKIQQLVPAVPGWKVLTFCGGCDSPEEAMILDDIACWALVVDPRNGQCDICPVTSFGDYMDLDNEGTDLVAILGPSEDPSKYKDEIAHRLKEERARKQAQKPQA